MGYDPAHTDPYEAVRRQMADDAAAAREAQSPGGTQPFQVVRKLQQQIDDLVELVTRLPHVVSTSDVQSGFGLSDVGSGEWKTVAQVVLDPPEDKNRVVVQATGQGAVLDTLSGGLTTAECRIVINSVLSAVIPASKDAGASAVNNVLTVSSVLEVTPLPGTVTVQFQMSPLNPAAFTSEPSNIANLSVYAGYSVV